MKRTFNVFETVFWVSILLILLCWVAYLLSGCLATKDFIEGTLEVDLLAEVELAWIVTGKH